PFARGLGLLKVHAPFQANPVHVRGTFFFRAVVPSLADHFSLGRSARAADLVALARRTRTVPRPWWAAGFRRLQWSGARTCGAGEARGVRGLLQGAGRSEEHTSELQSRENLVCR